MKTSRQPRVPERLEIGYSAFHVLLASAFYLFMVGACLFWAAIGVFSGHVVLIGVALVDIVFALPLLLTFLPSIVHPWLHRGPVLSMDGEGVTDARKKSSYIPWSDIDGVSLGVGERASFLCFTFRKADRERQDSPWLGPVGGLLYRLQSLGDWNVSLRLLACGKREALQAAEAFRQRSIRKEVARMNMTSRTASDPNQGCSGKL